MAIYRSDQAQFTYASEAGQGGSPELASTSTEVAYNSVINTTATTPGDRSISVTSVTNGATLLVGDFVRIGPEANNSEIRRVESIESTGTPKTIYLDYPCAFAHPAGDEVYEVSAVTDTDADKLITWVPGVYETVDAPDPEMAIEGRRLLGEAARRDWGVAYSGQQSFSGSVGGFVLLDGTPLRFPIGSVQSGSFQSDGSAAYSSISGDPTATCNKGDIYFTASSGSNVSVDDIIIFGEVSSQNAAFTATTTQEIRKVVSKSTNEIRVNYPFQFAHTAVAMKKVTSNSYYQHTIFGTTALDTLTWQIKMLDSAETNAFTRRYYGGMVDSATLSAEEGGLVTYGWDSVPFMGMVHNQYDYDGKTNDLSSAYPGGPSNTELPGYAIMHSIDNDNVGIPATSSGTVTHNFPSTEPYYFSQGEIKIHGITFARVRSFSLSISNGVEPRYYVKPTFGRNRGPNEMREQAREYGLSCTIASEDSAVGTSTSENANALFKELILEGDYGTPSSPSKKGLDVVLTFTRGTNDKIVVTIPDDGTAATGLNEQGAFITAANHSIDGNNPIQSDVDMIFRNMKIDIYDSIPVYP